MKLTCNDISQPSSFFFNRPYCISQIFSTNLCGCWKLCHAAIESCFSKCLHILRFEMLGLMLAEISERKAFSFSTALGLKCCICDSISTPTHNCQHMHPHLMLSSWPCACEPSHISKQNQMLSGTQGSVSSASALGCLF